MRYWHPLGKYARKSLSENQNVKFYLRRLEGSLGTLQLTQNIYVDMPVKQ